MVFLMKQPTCHYENHLQGDPVVQFSRILICFQNRYLSRRT